MESETSNVCYDLMWLGTSDPEHPPGDIDPKLTVLIADQGVGEDSPYALDYRVSFEQPRVVLYTWQLASGDVGNRWIEVAPNFPAFCEPEKGTS
jgi:hypothetical protein